MKLRFEAKKPIRPQRKPTPQPNGSEDAYAIREIDSRVWWCITSHGNSVLTNKYLAYAKFYSSKESAREDLLRFERNDGDTHGLEIVHITTSPLDGELA